jgi:hypothetical protein
VRGFDVEGVVMALIGPVRAVGESNEDANRLVNLNELTELVDRLLYTIAMAANAANRPEASMKKIGERAREYLEEVRNVQ